MKTSKVILFCLALITAGVNAQDKPFVKVLDGFKFAEGPAFDTDGNLYFTDIPESKIYKYTPDGKLSVYQENTGGANGLFFDSPGNLV